MIVQKISTCNESYTHTGWVYRDISSGFSRLYYVLDGEAYYEEGDRKVRLKKNHLYLTPVKKTFSLYDNPQNQLLHTHSHITTFPPIREFTEIEVTEGSPLADAVALWRKHIHTKDQEYLILTIQHILSCINSLDSAQSTVAEQIHDYLDTFDGGSLSMEEMSRALGYTREHLTRLFQASYRITPKQYLQTRKMNHAMALLLGGAKVQEVAEQLGYSGPYAFSKAFKAYYGLSPRQQLQLEREKNK